MILRRALIIPLLFLLAACQLQAIPATPPAASPSTPIADLVAFRAQQTTPTPIAQEIIDAADAEYLLLTNLYERVNPSVVNVDVTVSTPHPGIGDLASGSGFVYDAQGHIITNAHVVADATAILITFYDGYVADAELIGLDPYSDIAVVRVDVDAARLRPVVFADSERVRVGERAVAIGNPFGLASSMTVGIVSGLGRQLPSAELINTTGIGSFQNPSIIQVDADINPGNSGGPLLNSRGEVIGVNTAIRTESGVFQGVGFAVPSRTVQRVVPEIIEAGRVDYAWMGISSPSSENGFGLGGLAEPLSLPVTAGVLVSSITPNSPASKAGLRGGSREVQVRGRPVCAGGDIIVAIDGTYVDTMDELVAYLVMNVRPGMTVNLLVIRGSDTLDIPMVLESRPSDAAAVAPALCGS